MESETVHTMNLYLIPGLGADERLFAKLQIPGYELKVLNWIAPLQGEKISSYAARLAEQIDATKPFVIGGVSFGGLLAMEINSKLPAEKVIIISSIKSGSEISVAGTVLKYLPLYKMTPKSALLHFNPMLKIIFGASTREELELLKDMLRKTEKSFIDWAIHAIVNWRYTGADAKVLQLNGSKDTLLFGTKTKGAVLVNEGTHLMVLQQAEEISRIISAFLCGTEDPQSEE